MIFGHRGNAGLFVGFRFNRAGLVKLSCDSRTIKLSPLGARV